MSGPWSTTYFVFLELLRVDLFSGSFIDHTVVSLLCDLLADGRISLCAACDCVTAGVGEERLGGGVFLEMAGVVGGGWFLEEFVEGSGKGGEH